MNHNRFFFLFLYRSFSYVGPGHERGRVPASICHHSPADPGRGSVGHPQASVTERPCSDHRLLMWRRKKSWRVKKRHWCHWIGLDFLIQKTPMFTPKKTNRSVRTCIQSYPHKTGVGTWQFLKHDAEPRVFTFLWNRYHQWLADVELIQISTFCGFLFQDEPVFHCWKAKRGWDLTLNSLTRKIDYRRIYSLWLRFCVCYRAFVEGLLDSLGLLDYGQKDGIIRSSSGRDSSIWTRLMIIVAYFSSQSGHGRKRALDLDGAVASSHVEWGWLRRRRWVKLFNFYPFSRLVLHLFLLNFFFF
jgi:hypothetical protein